MQLPRNSLPLLLLRRDDFPQEDGQLLPALFQLFRPLGHPVLQFRAVPLDAVEGVGETDPHLVEASSERSDFVLRRHLDGILQIPPGDLLGCADQGVDRPNDPPGKPHREEHPGEDGHQAQNDEPLPQAGRGSEYALPGLPDGDAPRCHRQGGEGEHVPFHLAPEVTVLAPVALEDRVLLVRNQGVQEPVLLLAGEDPPRIVRGDDDSLAVDQLDVGVRIGMDLPDHLGKHVVGRVDLPPGDPHDIPVFALERDEGENDLLLGGGKGIDVRDHRFQLPEGLAHIRDADQVDPFVLPVGEGDPDVAEGVHEEDPVGEDGIFVSGLQRPPLGVPVAVVEVDLPGKGDVVEPLQVAFEHVIDVLPDDAGQGETILEGLVDARVDAQVADDPETHEDDDHVEDDEEYDSLLHAGTRSGSSLQGDFFFPARDGLLAFHLRNLRVRALDPRQFDRVLPLHPFS